MKDEDLSIGFFVLLRMIRPIGRTSFRKNGSGKIFYKKINFLFIILLSVV